MNSKLSQNNQYDSTLSQKYNSGACYEHPHQFMAYSSWLDEIGNVHGKDVLDLACGGGVSTRMISGRGARVVGVDVSDSMLAFALSEEVKNPSGIKYVQSDISIPERYFAKPFDVVGAAFLLHYASSLDMLRGFIENISINLKPGGRFVAINMSPEHPIISPDSAVSHSSKWIDTPFKDGSRVEVALWSRSGRQICTLVDYYWSRETYEKCLRDEGFENIRWTEIGKQNMLVVLSATKAS